MMNKYWYAEALHEDWKAANGLSVNDWDGPSPDRVAYVRDMDETDCLDDEGWGWDED
jgi:hypothetical protein